MGTFLLLFGCLYTIARVETVAAQEISNVGQKYFNRLSYGLWLTKVDDQFPVTSAWYLHFKLPMPPINIWTPNPGPPLSIIPNCESNTSCNQFRDHWTQYRQLLIETSINVFKLTETIHSLFPYEDTILMPRTETVVQTNNTARTQTTNASENVQSVNRTKRGIIATLVVGGVVAAGVSALISNYWGDDYSTDIAIMKANIARLAQTNRDQLEALQAATKAMHHYTIATDAYVLTLAENIMQQTKMLAYQLDQSNTHTTQIINRLATVTAHLQQINRIALSMPVHLTNVLSGLQLMLNGQLSPYILPKRDLDYALRWVQIQCQKDFPDHKVIHKQAYYYYQKGQFTMSRKDNDLYVMVKVDLTRFPLPFEIYQIQYLHTPLTKDSDYFTKLVQDESYLAIDSTFNVTMKRNPSHFYMIQYEPTRTKANKLEIIRPVIHKAHTCVTAILYELPSIIRQVCQYVIEPIINTTYVKQLQRGIFYAQNIPNFTLKCAETTNANIHTLVGRSRTGYITGCHSCIVQIPEECSLQTDQLEVFTFNANTEETSIMNRTNVINLSTMLYALDTNLNINISAVKLNAINNKLDNTTTIIIQKLQQTLANNSAVRTDLKMAIAAVRATMQMAEDLQPVELLGYDIDASERMPWYRAFIGSTVGILGTTVTCVVIVLIMHAIHLHRRVGQLMLILAMTTRTPQVVSLPILVTETIANSTEILNNIWILDNYVASIGGYSKANFYATCLVIAILILLGILRIFTTQFRRRDLLTPKTKAFIQLSSSIRTLWIELLRIPAPIGDLKASALEPCTNIILTFEITGPKLSVVWNGLKIRNTTTNITWEIPRRVKLTLVEAYKVSRILKQEFLPILILASPNKVYRPDVQLQTAPPAYEDTPSINPAYSGTISEITT